MKLKFPKETWFELTDHSLKPRPITQRLFLLGVFFLVVWIAYPNFVYIFFGLVTIVVITGTIFIVRQQLNYAGRQKESRQNDPRVQINTQKHLRVDRNKEQNS